MSKYRTAIQFENVTKYITVKGADTAELAEVAALDYYRKKADGNIGIITEKVADDFPDDVSCITVTQHTCPTCGQTIRSEL